MTLEQLVTDLATSQELRDKGFPQDTAMVWVSAEEFDEYEVGENREPVLMERTETLDEDGEPMYEFVAAPTAGELEEWLLCNGCDNILTKNESADGENAVGVSCIHSDGRDFEVHETTEIKAKAALVLQALP